MTTSLSIFTLMILNLSTMIILINSIPSYYKSFHPLIMGTILMIMNIILSMNLSILLKSNWWSYINFLIIVGGLMILFMYFTSFINNLTMSMKFNFFKKMLLKSTLLYMILIEMFLNLDKFLIWYQTINTINLFEMLNNKEEIKLIFMYMYNLNYSILLTIFYLLMSLFMIVKMIIINKYSLRKMN